MKKFFTGVLAFYLVMSLINGLAICRSIPALNWMGGVYYGITWPLWAVETMMGSEMMPIPQWAFTFD